MCELATWPCAIDKPIEHGSIEDPLDLRIAENVTAADVHADVGGCDRLHW